MKELKREPFRKRRSVSKPSRSCNRSSMLMEPMISGNLQYFWFLDLFCVAFSRVVLFFANSLLPLGQELSLKLGGKHFHKKGNRFCFVLFCFGLVWFVLFCFVLVWFGLIWLGLVWFGLVWFGPPRLEFGFGSCTVVALSYRSFIDNISFRSLLPLFQVDEID